METYSFIDFGLRDFLRDENGDVIKVRVNHVQQAEDWLLENGENYGWRNMGIRYWCWEDEED